MSHEEVICTYVEFYAGIGGWTMALHEALGRYLKNTTDRSAVTTIRLERLAALDHSDLCLAVLQHNFPDSADSSSRKRKQPQAFRIERVTVSQANEWNADIWAMSPPCQPHTRQHSNQAEELNDPRSQSFLHLCDLVECMDGDLRPRLLLLENVVGFESSQSCQRWRAVLSRCGYATAHFHLTPTQVQIPNDRPRYYCVAVRVDSLVVGMDRLSNSLHQYVQNNSDELGGPTIQRNITELGVSAIPTGDSPKQSACVQGLPCISQFLDSESKDGADLRIPDKLLGSNASWCFDIVTPGDRRSACFTSSYGRFARGTGSVLYEPDDSAKNQSFKLIPPEERVFNPAWSEGLDLKRKLRYFSGREVARLMGFLDTVHDGSSKSFSFPETCSVKQQWKLLGNSLNVSLAARVSELGIRLIDLGKYSRLSRP